MPVASIELVPGPADAELRRLIRARLAGPGRPLRVILEGAAGADAPIDLVAADASGRCVLVLCASQGGDLELIGNALAQRAHVSARLRDWLALSPGLGVDPEIPPRLILLAPHFGGRARAAARAAGRDGIELLTWRRVRIDGGSDVLLEPDPESACGVTACDGGGPLPPFRTGLGDADLGLVAEGALTADELGAFE